MNNLSELRHEHQKNKIQNNHLENTSPSPWDQLDLWIKEALAHSYFQPNAMSLATVSPDGKPSCRMVLLKSFSPEGIIFYTHYLSKKAQELAHFPHAALLLYWDKQERQIRIEGQVKKISPEESDQYFSSRPRGSQISAAISPQSQKIPDREYLEQKYLKLEQASQDKSIPRPEDWGGYCLVPSYFEFWQGRESRLHDRVIYQRANTSSGWEKSLLAP